MRFGYLYITLFAAMTAIVSSCDKEEAVETTPPGGGNVSHWALFGLKGNVQEVSANYYDDLSDPSSAYDPSSMTFDKEGRLTSYVAMTGSYSYAYDTDKPEEVIAVFEDGRGEIKYRLYYDGHGAYAPCPFIFGGLDFYLIKGLSRVVATGGNDYSFTYSCNGERMESTESYDGMIFSDKVIFSGGYPLSRERTLTVEGSEEGEYIEYNKYSYEYNRAGALQASEKTSVLYGETTVTKSTYSEAKLQKDEVFYSGEDGADLVSLYTDLYTYDADGNLIGHVRKDSENLEETDMETCSYNKYDEEENWVVKYGKKKMPWGLSMSPYYVKREIKYFKTEITNF